MKKLIYGIAALALLGAAAQVSADDHKSVICHKGKTISVANPAVKAHMNHGDSMGECEDGENGDDPERIRTVVMMRCDGMTGDNSAVTIVSFSSSEDLEPPVEAGDDCAEVLADLMNDGYMLRSITSGSAEDDDSLRLYTDYLLLGTAEVE